MFKAIVALRKDLESKYNPDSVLQRGEVNFVELSSGEIKIKVGDGETKFKNLLYVDSFLQKKIESVIVRGYYSKGSFYEDPGYTILLTPHQYVLYIDTTTLNIYSYNGTDYELISTIQQATSEKPGIMKLYKTLGDNEDGTVTQLMITEGLNKKVEMGLGPDGETLILTDYK